MRLKTFISTINMLVDTHSSTSCGLKKDDDEMEIVINKRHATNSGLY
jgi:hypothetical protein